MNFQTSAGCRGFLNSRVCARWFKRLLIATCLAGSVSIPSARAEDIQTIELKDSVGPSQLDRINADWLFPRGRQVLDGVPFQMDGVIELYGTGSAQRRNPGRTNVTDIPLGRACERIHLLAATDDSGQDTNRVATLRLNYADGSNAALEVVFGFHVRRWVAAWHKTSAAPRDPATHVAWAGQHAEAAKQDEFARLFHSVFTNPTPEKIVKTISLESTRARPGLWVAAISVGPANAAPQADTIPLPQNFPDLRPRSGEPASVRGAVKTRDGRPLKGVLVRVTGARPLGTNDRETREDDPAVGTETMTDAEGRFTVPPLPDTQLYRLIAVGVGVQPAFYRGADPKADPIEIRLAAASETKTQANIARGRVVDANDKPIAGALVEFNAAKSGSGTSFSSGSYAGFPDEMVTDLNGEFVMSSAKPFESVQVRVSAPNLAPAKAWLDATNGIQIIQLKEGCSVRGRLVLNHAPVAGVQVGLSDKDREASVYAGHFETMTGTNGDFEFKHLPSARQWWLFGKMSSLKKFGATRPRLVTTTMNGEVLEAGELEVSPALHLAGSMRTRTGEPLPSGLKITVAPDEASDSQTAALDKEGGFNFAGLAPGLIELSFNSQNWHLSGANRSLEEWNTWRMIGLLEHDKTNLVIVIERGERGYGGYSSNGQLPPEDQSRSRPLSGAEPGAPPITIAGKVVDNDSGQPIKNFKIIPGRKPPVTSMPVASKPLLQQLTDPFRKKVTPWNELPFWDRAREENFTNGIFSVDFEPLKSTPMLQFEASGYDPFVTEPMQTSTNGLVVRLQTGAGPSGVVLLPNGQPASGATVIYGAAHDQHGLTGFTLNSYGSTNWLRTTGADGRFTFPARKEGEAVFAAHTNGWATEQAGNGDSGLKLRLQPWAVVCGTLVQSNGPAMAGIPLHLGARYDGQHPYVNNSLRVKTDAKGWFLFTNVPPGRLELNREVPMGSGGWRNVAQTRVEVRPGVTNNLGNVFYDMPPPPTVFEQIQQQLGL